jgi:N6-L-threonylcarbamoyladenine synthase
MQKSKRNVKILSIDTSCDETAASVTENTKILSNIIWSQASLHAKWGGVVPSLAQREHQKRIDWVIQKALKNANTKISDLDAVAVTAGPGLAIALEVGVTKAKEISQKHKLPFISVNHIEGHLLSPLAKSKNSTSARNTLPTFPAYGIVTSGGHTEIVLIKNIGSYQVIAQTVDDALGESLDKAARLLGFGYPGGAVLEKFAREGNSTNYNLPIPMLGREKEMCFSYSGLKTAFFRLLSDTKEKKVISPKDTSNLAAAFQHVAFTHLLRVLDFILKSKKYKVENILAGGGVMANVTLRKMLRTLAKKHKIKILFPYSKKLYTDNAAMVGIAAYFKFKRGKFLKPNKLEVVDRVPGAKVDVSFLWE